MARQNIINTADDMRWLRDVHLPKLPAKYKSAIIVGNEDYPDRIEVYERRDPLYTDKPVIFKADEDGVFKEMTAPARHHSTMKTGGKKTPTQLNREIAAVLGTRSQTRGDQRHHATMKTGTGSGASDKPQILKISRPKTFAGQRSISAYVQYAGEEPTWVEFVGPSTGGSGPVVMVTKGRQTFVTDPSRLGVFGVDWVRRFFA